MYDTKLIQIRLGVPVCRALLMPCLCLASALCLVFSDVMWM